MSPDFLSPHGSAGDPAHGAPPAHAASPAHGATPAHGVRPAHGASAAHGASEHPLRRLPVTLEPDRNLLKYYMLTALLFGPALIFAAVPFYFRFRTLRYDVDEEGITMRWGILFRREVSLTYARIQDIQLTSNVVERWLGLARIQLQTASGSATAEMTIEGMLDVDAIRDFLYSRMRGAHDDDDDDAASAPGIAASSRMDLAAAGVVPEGAAGIAELVAALDAVADELRALRNAAGGQHTIGGSDG